MAGDYIVYGATGSGSMPVEAALTLMKQPFRVIEAVTWESEAERDKVAAVNPMRQIPALITPDGETITESAAILIWLAERHPEAGLAPPPGDARQYGRRGQFLRWMTFVPAAVYSMYWVRDVPSRLVGDDEGTQKLMLERTSERIADCWRTMESQIAPTLEPGDFLTGDRVSVLDLYVTAVSRWSPRRKRFAEVAPRMADVVRRVDALPELAEFWSGRWPFAEGEER
jgi:GST-like protein